MIRFSIFILLLNLFIVCKKEKQDLDCIDPEKIKLNQACIEIYQPVCGCDNKTYSNECHAIKRGIIDFQMGECDI